MEGHSRPIATPQKEDPPLLTTRNQLTPVPLKVKASQPKRIVRQAIPDSILLNPELNATVAKSLPPNYSFEVHKTVWRVQQAKAATVALQFPEGLLMYATTLSDILERFAGVKHCIILGDVAYGACCIDDITASTLGADLLVHYGHSCLVPVNSTVLPCLYIFVGIAIDTPHLVATTLKNFPENTRIVLAGTIQFSSAVQQVCSALREENRHVTVPQAKPLSSGEVLGCTAPRLELNKSSSEFSSSQRREQQQSSSSNKGRLQQQSNSGALPSPRDGKKEHKKPSVHDDRTETSGSIGDGSEREGRDGREGDGGHPSLPESVLVFVADGRFHLEAMMIANPELPAFRYDPFTRNLLREHYDHRGMRAARRAAVEKSKRAQVWGVVLGTLGRQGNLRTLGYVCNLLKAANRTATVFLVSELSPAKVRLFEGVIEAWVQIACPRLSIDWGEAFTAPLLTTYEVSVAFGKAKPWWSSLGASASAEAPPSLESPQVEGGACLPVTDKAHGKEWRTSATAHELNSREQIPATCCSGKGCGQVSSEESSGSKTCRGKACGPECGGLPHSFGGEEDGVYPMDFYAMDGGPWNSVHMGRPKAKA